MKNLINRLVVKRRNIIIEEEDITSVLIVLRRHISIWHKEMVIGNCGWTETTKWFVHFDASDDEWNRVINDLKSEKFKSIFTRPSKYGYVEI